MSTINSVLLAEDHDVTRRGMETFLATDMHVPHVEGYTTLPPAIIALRARQFDLAIIDLHLPGLQSTDQLRHIRLAWPAMKVVVMSGVESRTDIIASLEAGVHGYIMKTTPMQDVGRIIERIMTGELIYVPPHIADVSWTAEEPIDRLVAADQSRHVLPPRQRDVLEAMAEGLSNPEIAAKLGIAVGTVKMHVTGLFQTLGVHKRAQAVIVGQKYLRRKPKR